MRRLVKEATDGWGADYVVEAVGKQETLNNAVAVSAPGGVVSVVGVFQQPVSVNAPRMLAKNVTLTIGMGDLGRIQELVDLIAAGQARPDPAHHPSHAAGRRRSTPTRSSRSGSTGPSRSCSPPECR